MEKRAQAPLHHMIRHATDCDIATITSIYNEAVADGGFTGDITPVTIESRAAWHTEHQHGYAIFVIEIAAVVAGYVAISPYRKGREAFGETCEVSYYVARAHRYRGVGRQLLSHALEHASTSGFRVMVAILLGSNERSVKLLAHFGFSECGRIPEAACIDGKHVDHLYMSRRVMEQG